MKKTGFIIALTLGLSLLAGCSGGSAPAASPAKPASESTEAVTEAAPEAGGLVGGWTVLDAESSLSEAEAEIFEKAQEKWVGADFEPVAVIATQVVAGTNYCYLAKATTVTATPDVHYSFVYVYADLEGNAEISGVKDIEIDIDIDEDTGETTEGLAGGWSLSDPDGASVENKEVLEKALDGFVGSKLAPVACLATQVVAGTNYCYLVKETLVTAQPASYVALVYVYEDLEGNAEILNIHTIDYMPE